MMTSQYYAFLHFHELIFFYYTCMFLYQLFSLRQAKLCQSSKSSGRNSKFGYNLLMICR